MSMSLEPETPEKRTGEIRVSHDDDEVRILGDMEKSKSKAPSESCLLCGSRDERSFEMESANRVKWTLHFCQLFRIDECPLVAQTTKAEMWTTMQGALYCSDCMDSLERISHLLQTIEDINAQLRVIQLQCEAKLRAAKQNLHDPHEVNRRRSLWTCMRVGEATLSGADRDLRVTGIELPSTSGPVVNEKDDWRVRDAREEAEPGSNSPASLFSLPDTDSDSSFDSVKQEPLDSSGSSLSPMPILPIQVIQEQSDVVIKMEPADTPSGSEDQDDEEETEEGARGRGKRHKAEAARSRKNSSELPSKRSKTLRPKRKSNKQPKAASIQNEKRKSGKEESESGTEDEDKDKGESEESSSSSSSNSSSAAAPARKRLRRKRKRRPVQKKKVEADSGSGSEEEEEKEKPTPRKAKAGAKPRRKSLVKPKPKVVREKKSGGRGEWRQTCPFAPECKRLFHTKAKRDEHVVLVHEGKKFTCEICGQSYGLQKLLEEHGNTHKGLTPFKCKDCPQEFAMSHHLRMHKLKRHSDRPFKCTPCGKAFITEVHFTKHLNSPKHVQKNELWGTWKEAQDPAKPRLYPPRMKVAAHKCPFPNCEKVYTLKYSLTTHMRTHDDSIRASLTCSFCQRSFETKHSLKQHEALQHTGEASFRCEHCPFLSMNKFILQKHIDTVHSEERPVQCDICGHTFKHTSYLRRHMQSIHPTTKDHMCSICGKCFSNKRYLQEHDETHKEIKSFLCTHCGRGFTQRTSLNKHMRSVHKIFGSGQAPKGKDAIKIPSEHAHAHAGNQPVQGYAGHGPGPSQFPPELFSLFPPSFQSF